MNSYTLSTLRQRVIALSAKSSLVKDSAGYYQVTTDSTGTGNAILRFLPALPGEDFPFVQLYNHAFQGPTGKWLIEHCPSTIEQPCPICQANKLFLKSGSESQKTVASTRKRKMSYISNVLVVKDLKAAEREGKVYFFKFGVRIMDKIKGMIAPSFSDIEPTDPFDVETGANFQLRVIKSGNFPDYDTSAFDKPSSIGDHSTIDTVIKQCRSLQELVSPFEFKTFDELKAKFDKIGELATSVR